ncbi:MAG: DUF4926 domain-containing protein [Candidatus Sumerlaeia bacterium]|nr:DUF4926 domain-containing protein [Candidatus Sumerlaeia bacterium]
MIPEHSLAVLLSPSPPHGLVAGDVGTVVHVHDDGAGYEVEFMDVLGQTIAVLTVDANDLRELREGERAIPHLRSA